MAISDEQIAFVQDLFESLGQVSIRKMFGGLGVYLDGTIFAIVMSDGDLKLKGAGSMPTVFEDAGWAPWTYTRKDGASSSMPYWKIPEELLDDPQEVCAWAQRALAELR